MGQLVVVVVVVTGDDLRPGHLVTGQLLVERDPGQIPAENGRHISSQNLKGSRQVGRLHQDLLRGHCRKPKRAGRAR